MLFMMAMMRMALAMSLFFVTFCAAFSGPFPLLGCGAACGKPDRLLVRPAPLDGGCGRRPAANYPVSYVIGRKRGMNGFRAEIRPEHRNGGQRRDAREGYIVI